MLDWSPLLPDLGPAEQARLAAALQATGAQRIVLAGAGDEAALRWGYAHGIRRFLGRHVEVMLAAARMFGCAAAAGCTLGQCAARAGATGQAGRHACGRPDLLDAATPRHFADAPAP